MPRLRWVALAALVVCGCTTNVQPEYHPAAGESEHRYPMTVKTAVQSPDSLEASPCCVINFGPDFSSTVASSINSHFQGLGDNPDLTASVSFSATPQPGGEVRIVAVFQRPGSTEPLTSITRAEVVHDSAAKVIGTALLAITGVGILPAFAERAAGLRSEYQDASGLLLQDLAQAIRADPALNSLARSYSPNYKVTAIASATTGRRAGAHSAPPPRAPGRRALPVIVPIKVVHVSGVVATSPVPRPVEAAEKSVPSRPVPLPTAYAAIEPPKQAAAPRAPVNQITGKRLALVVGNSAYQHVPRLGNPSNDARLMAKTLRGLGFALVGDGPQIDLDKSAFDHAIKLFGDQLPGVSVALFYYTGHGIQVHGDNFLVPTSAELARDADASLEMVNVQSVLDQMQEENAHLNVVILDACRNNPFRGLSREVSGGLGEMKLPRGTLIRYSTAPGAVAQDGTGRDSPFTRALADKIASPGEEIRDVFNDVGLEIEKRSGENQIPWQGLSPIDGKFYFAGNP